MVDVTASEQPLIEAAGVTKRFGEVTALDDVSTSVTSPALGLLGANGAGKSTFMKSMLGLVTPDSGQVRVLGMDAAHQAREIRRMLGYMPENMCLPMGMTARDFIVHMGELRGLPRRVAVLRASEVLFQVGLEEERSRLIRTFSIGMKQRTNLAQAIVHSPSLVILDEPTNGLDPAGREEMLALVRGQRAGGARRRLGRHRRLRGPAPGGRHHGDGARRPRAGIRPGRRHDAPRGARRGRRYGRRPA